MQDTTDTGLLNVREFGAMCVPPRRKKQERISSIGNATSDFVLPHVSRYIIPNCISEDQLTHK
jgi:hypothetical protein